MKPEYCTQNNGDCSTCSLVNYGKDCKNEKLFEINIDWQEPWSAQADEYVAAGTKVRKVVIGAKSFAEALEKANKYYLSAEEKEDMDRNNAGVL